MQDWKKKLKFIFITSAFAVLILIVLNNVFNMTQVSDKDFKTYRQGLTYLNQKDYENAYFNFSNVSKNSALYEIALLRQAMSADELKDSETAAKKYRMFIEKYPESIFVQKAYYSLAQNYFREKDYSKAEKTFNQIKRNFKDSEYKTAANYYLGMIYTENKTPAENPKAKNYFADYLKEAPDGRFAMNCVDEMMKSTAGLSQNDYFLIGKTYLKNGQNKAAIENLNKSYMASSWGYLSMAYKNSGDRKKAAEIFENGYPLYSNGLEKEELYEVIESYALSHPAGIKNGFQKALEIARNNKSAGEDFILYRLSKYEEGSAKTEIHKEIYTKFPNGKFASDALANLFWQAYKNNEFQDALKLGQIHAQNYPNTIAAPKVLFWMGKITEKSIGRIEAKPYYQRILNKYPDDYYAYRASKKLSISANSNWKTKASHRLPESNQAIPFPLKHTNISDDNVSLVNAVLRLNDYNLLGEVEKENKAIQSWIKYKEGKYGTSALLARDVLSDYDVKPDFSDSLYKLAYQLHYQEPINDFSKINSLDPFLVTALIREESYFNPQVKSPVGAVGLMQIMPSTAFYIATKEDVFYNGTSALLNPEKNIELGCAYLKYAKQRLYQDDMLAVASYNGGPNAVRNWKDTLNYKNFDEFIENIPYIETRDYVKKVFRSYWVYLNVY